MKSQYFHPKLCNWALLALIYQASNAVSMLMFYVMLNANPNVKMSQLGIRCSRAKQLRFSLGIMKGNNTLLEYQQTIGMLTEPSADAPFQSCAEIPLESLTEQSCQLSAGLTSLHLEIHSEI